MPIKTNFLAFVLGLLVYICPNKILAQHQHDVYYVQLTNKQNTPFSLLRPHDFLSERSIARRKRQNIQLNESDLPINPAYIAQIESLGVAIEHSSKWLNAVAVLCPDANKRELIKKLPFVQYIKPLGYDRPIQNYKIYDRAVKDTSKLKESVYGWAENQNKMLQIHHLHNFGYKGEGQYIAIFDGGFEQAYRMVAFDSLFLNHRILGTYDIVEGDEWVYEASGHGTDVLGVMGGNMPYRLLGTSPNAGYFLFKTEDTKGEFWTEEFNWVVAAEKADSLGVDVINSSLGYTSFRDTAMNYKYKDLNGRTGIATIGADIATQKGMLVINSAGNEGRGSWRYIGVPADGFNVIAVGATNNLGFKAGFSSFGPTPDARIKPNLSAQGQDVFTASMFGFATKAISGTSFSAPILAGAISSLWSACPNKTNFELKFLLEKSASQWEKPDSLLGYGIPNFLASYLEAQDDFWVAYEQGQCFYNKKIASKQIKIIHSHQQPLPAQLSISDSWGTLVYQDELQFSPFGDFSQLIIPTQNLANGVYTIKINMDKKIFHIPFYQQQLY